MKHLLITLMAFSLISAAAFTSNTNEQEKDIFTPVIFTETQAANYEKIIDLQAELQSLQESIDSLSSSFDVIDYTQIARASGDRFTIQDNSERFLSVDRTGSKESFTTRLKLHFDKKSQRHKNKADLGTKGGNHGITNASKIAHNERIFEQKSEAESLLAKN